MGNKSSDKIKSFKRLIDLLINYYYLLEKALLVKTVL